MNSIPFPADRGKNSRERLKLFFFGPCERVISNMKIESGNQRQSSKII